LTGETCRLGIEPRKQWFRTPTLLSERKAISGISVSRDMLESCAVGDPMHARKHLARESGDPTANHDDGINVVRAVNPRSKTAMDGCGKSDSSILPKKFANKGTDSSASAEWMEGRELAERNSHEQNRCRAQDRENLQNKLARVRQIAAESKETQFTTLWHHVYNIDRLREAFFNLKRKSAKGVDGETWKHYAENLEENLKGLSSRLARGAYHAKPVRRVYIPKPDGRQRPIGIPTLEDKIAQSATAEVLNAIYETDFKDFSYGFRPGRSQHQALDALALGIQRKKVNWVLDIDIRAFFDTIDHEWLIKFVEHRITDKRVLRHIRKWLNAGVLEDGKIRQAEYGTPQGGSLSPLLANIYLHYALDIWADIWRRRTAKGEMIMVRFADDAVFGFQYRSDAEKFLEELKKRFSRFHLELNAEKTRLIEFGRFAVERRIRHGEGKPETFDFLGFTHICDKTRNGKFIVLRKTKRKKMQAKLKEIKLELRLRLHDPVPKTGAWLRSVLLGHYRYYGVPRNADAMGSFRHHLTHLWHRSLRRRSQKSRCNWDRMQPLIQRWLPVPKIMHPYPNERLSVIT
jgi:RNA-directed DNA polymerase